MLTKLALDADIKKAIDDMGFTEWTEIQLKTIPIVRTGKDLIAQSHTGSGKTGAFGIPMIEKTTHTKKVQKLVIVPTRELCEQVTQELSRFSKYKRINITAVYGGVSINPQIDNLRMTDIVVGTPGRLLDHIVHHTIDLREVNTLVLDEADRMLDMGFIDDIKKIMSHLSKNAQILLFSATMPTEIKKIVHQFMKNPENIKTASYVDKGKLSQYYYTVDQRDKFSMLVHILNMEKSALTIVFTATRHMADNLVKNLQYQNVKAEVLHGGLPQHKRKLTINAFINKKIDVLVASDVAARGLDVKDISHVINYDIPKTSTEYIHRIGRTARAGEEGKVFSIVTYPDFDNFRRVMEDRSLTIKKLENPAIVNIPFKIERSNDRDSRGGNSRGGGGRSSGGFRGRGSGGWGSNPRGQSGPHGGGGRGDRRSSDSRNSDGRSSEGRGEGRSENSSRDGHGRGRSENRFETQRR